MKALWYSVNDYVLCSAIVIVVDLAATEEEVSIGEQSAVMMVDTDAAQGVLEAGYTSVVDGVATAKLDAGVEATVGVPPEVAADRYPEVLAAIKTSEGTGGAAEDGEVVRAGSGRYGLRARHVRVKGEGKKQRTEHRGAVGRHVAIVPSAL